MEVSTIGTVNVEKPAESEIINEATYTGAFSIVTVQFEEGYKWRLASGTDRITANLADNDFISLIEQNQIAFAKGDILIVQVSAKTWRNPDNSLRNENDIIKVIEHIKKSEQTVIQFNE